MLKFTSTSKNFSEKLRPKNLRNNRENIVKTLDKAKLASIIYMATWLHGYMATWLHGYMATWLHGYMATWLHGYMAEGGTVPRRNFVVRSENKYEKITPCAFAVNSADSRGVFLIAKIKGDVYMTNERSRLESIAADSLYASGVNAEAMRYSFKIANRYLVGSVLEMGPAEGIMTELIAKTWKDVTVVEGSSIFCKQIKDNFSNVNVVNALFEEFEPSKNFDSIILGHVLEHVEDPVDILRRAKGWLTQNGKIFAAVPNARSLHRQAAVIMGLLRSEDELNDMDRHHGHRRVFSPESFRKIFMEARLKIEIFGGYWLKPVSNSQIEQSWNNEMLSAFMTLGERYPDIAGEIYVVAADWSDEE